MAEPYPARFCLKNAILDDLRKLGKAHTRASLRAGPDAPRKRGFAEFSLGMTLQKHRDHALEAVHDYLANGGTVWP